MGEDQSLCSVSDNTRISSVVQNINDLFHFIKSPVSAVLQNVNTMQFFRHVDGLRTMRRTLVASDAMVGLPQFGYTPVISYQESTPRSFRSSHLGWLSGRIPFVDTLVVMYQMAGISMPYGQGMQYLQSLQGMVGYCIINLPYLQILYFLICQRYQWRVSTDVILQMFHISHAAQHCQYIPGKVRQNGMPTTPHCVRVRAASAVPQYGRGHWIAAHPAEAP